MFKEQPMRTQRYSRMKGGNTEEQCICNEEEYSEPQEIETKEAKAHILQWEITRVLRSHYELIMGSENKLEVCPKTQ